jgi:hypothetical protein
VIRGSLHQVRGACKPCLYTVFNIIILKNFWVKFLFVQIFFF